MLMFVAATEKKSQKGRGTGFVIVGKWNENSSYSQIDIHNLNYK